MGLIQTSYPTESAVSLDTIKLHCRVTGDAEDMLLSAWTKAAVNVIQNERNLQLQSATYELHLDGAFPAAIFLPVCPVKSIDSITYVDSNGTVQTLADTDYRTGNLNNDHSATVITSVNGKPFPKVQNVIDSIVISITAGYDTIPDDLTAAILLYVAERYSRREITIDSKYDAMVPRGFDELIAMRGMTISRSNEQQPHLDHLNSTMPPRSFIYGNNSNI